LVSPKAALRDGLLWVDREFEQPVWSERAVIQLWIAWVTPGGI
jgi:hypothetical protein